MLKGRENIYVYMFMYLLTTLSAYMFLYHAYIYVYILYSVYMLNHYLLINLLCLNLSPELQAKFMFCLNFRQKECLNNSGGEKNP